MASLQDVPMDVAVVLSFARLLAAVMEYALIVSRAEGDEAAAQSNRARLLSRWAKIGADAGATASGHQQHQQEGGGRGNKGGPPEDLRDRDVMLRPIYLLK